MLIDFLASIFEKELKFPPTDSQKLALHRFGEFIADTDSNNKIFLLKGYAGTGKTSLINAYVKGLGQLKHKVELMAPTGRAAKVMSQYTQMPAYTIHKRIYRQRSQHEGVGRFVLGANLMVNTVFFVDEASMISDRASENQSFGSGYMLDDLMQFVYNGRNCKLVLVGDSAQLPPVGISISPALDGSLLSREFLKEVIEVELTEVMRQSENSGILANANLLRDAILKNQKSEIKLDVDRFPDIERVTGDELPDIIANSYDNNGVGETMLITRSNKRANGFNEGIRRVVQWKDSQINSGDFLMVVKNNYEGYTDMKDIDFIANGDIAEVLSVRNFQEFFGFQFADAVLRFPDYNDTEVSKKIMLDTLSTEAPALTQEQNKKLFFEVEKDYMEFRNKKTRYEKIRQDPFFSALQIKFAYAVTCHKAQGGQWKHVFLDHGYLPENELDVDTLRWMYTAFTRARYKLFLVNFKDEFFL